MAGRTVNPDGPAWKFHAIIVLGKEVCLLPVYKRIGIGPLIVPSKPLYDPFSPMRCHCPTFPMDFVRVDIL